MALTKKDQEIRVRLKHSLLLKIFMLTTLGMLITGLPMLGISIATFRGNISRTLQEYMLDMASAYGSDLAEDYTRRAKAVFEADSLRKLYGDVRVSGYESSYIYIVGADGTMLYHPNAEKIGQPVENTAVSKIVEEIASGEDVEGSRIDVYDYHGIKKYASIFVDKGKNFLFVVTMDESDMMEPIRNASLLMIGILFVAFFVVGILDVLLSRRYIVRPIQVLVQTTEKLAALDFNMDDALERASRQQDEVGLIGKAICRMRAQLLDTVELIKEEAGALQKSSEGFSRQFAGMAESVGYIGDAIADLAKENSRQAEETASANVRVANIGTVIDKNTENIISLGESSHQMYQTSKATKEILAQLVRTAERSTANIDLVAEQTVATSLSVEKIKQAVELIEEVADQTNLLSLNASIEAARAGESGKGFAVVASEIRSLAENSAASANDISTTVRELIQNSEISKEKMNTVKRDIMEQGEKLSSTIREFEKLGANVENASEIAEDISAQNDSLISQKQSLSSFVAELGKISEANAENTEKTSFSIHQLQETMEELQDAVANLKELGDVLNQQAERFRM